MGILTTSESTEVIHGAENIVERMLEGYATCNETIDGCSDHTGPRAVVTTEPIFKLLNEHAKRGTRLRYITEIIPNNIPYCKEMLKNGHQVRHLDGVKGNFGIIGRTEYFAYSIQREGEPPTQVTVTSVRSFVESQKHSFDALWQKAIPAQERIREIEEEIRPDFIETISDPNEIQKLGSDLVKRAKEEVLIIFPTPIHRQERAALRQLLQEVTESRDNVKIRVLTPIEEEIIQENTIQEKLKQNQKLIFDI